MRLVSFLAIVGVLLVPVWQAPSATACAHEIDEDFGLVEQKADCYGTGADVRALLGSRDSSNYAYRYDQLCKARDRAGKCDPPRACELANGERGTLWSVWRRRITPPEPDFSPYIDVCLTFGEEDEFELISWQRVWAVMKSMEWPQAQLEIQPVGGRTLINFETNFFTSTTEKIQAVQLLGRRVEIKAVPESYTWHWGDGSNAESGDEPGTPHHDGKPHPVFHVYTDAGVTVRPSLDVTYRGEFRIEGEGPQWQPIAPTLTVVGDPVALDVVSARVQLVG